MRPPEVIPATDPRLEAMRRRSPAPNHPAAGPLLPYTGDLQPTEEVIMPGPSLTVTFEPDTQPTILPALAALHAVLSEATGGRAHLDVSAATAHDHVSMTAALRLDSPAPSVGRLFATLAALCDGEIGAATSLRL